jgi:hypothetical protein
MLTIVPGCRALAGASILPGGLATLEAGPESWSVTGTTPAAKRGRPKWPTAESLLTRLVEGLTAGDQT